MFEFSFSAGIEKKQFSPLIKRLNRVAETIRLSAGFEPDAVIGVHICDEVASAALNARFRNQDKPTDVLSWSLRRSGTDWPVPAESKLIGEIAICHEICVVQTHANGWAFDVEFTRLLIHGIAHISGYDHQTPEDDGRMVCFEKKLLCGIGYDSIYP